MVHTLFTTPDLDSTPLQIRAPYFLFLSLALAQARTSMSSDHSSCTVSVGCSTCINIGGLQLHVGVACWVGMLLQNLWCITAQKRTDVEVGIVDWNVMGKWNDGLNEKGRHGCGRAVSSSTVSVGQQSGCFCDCWNVSCKLLICRFLVCPHLSVSCLPLCQCVFCFDLLFCFDLVLYFAFGFQFVWLKKKKRSIFFQKRIVLLVWIFPCILCLNGFLKKLADWNDPSCYFFCTLCKLLMMERTLGHCTARLFQLPVADFSEICDAGVFAADFNPPRSSLYRSCPPDRYPSLPLLPAPQPPPPRSV